MRPLPGLILLLVSLTAAQALAQPRIEAAELLEPWVAQQRRAFDALDLLRLQEASEQEVDGPYRRRTVRYEHVVTVRDRQVTRELRRATIDGEPADMEKAENHRRRIARALGPDYAAARRLADAPAYFLGRLEVVSSPRRERIGGRTAWRVELRAREDEPPVDRATLWFAEDHRRPVLLESRLVLQGEEPANVVTLRTTYAAVDGPAGPLAVPQRQAVEAFVQQRRRWRTFTVVVNSVREASEIEASWQSPGARNPRR